MSLCTSCLESNILPVKFDVGAFGGQVFQSTVKVYDQNFQGGGGRGSSERCLKWGGGGHFKGSFQLTS